MMSLIFALEAAVNGPTGPRAILFDGLGRTKRRRRQSGQRPTPGFSRRKGGRAPCGQGHFTPQAGRGDRRGAVDTCRGVA
jgi:hypothetical protein